MPKATMKDKSEGIAVFLRARHKTTLERARFALGGEGYASLNEWFNTQLDKLASKAPSRGRKATPHARKSRKAPRKAPARRPAPRKSRVKAKSADAPQGEPAVKDTDANVPVTPTE